MKRTAALIFTKENLTVSFTAEDDGLELLQKPMTAFVAKLAQLQEKDAVRTFRTGKERNNMRNVEAVIFDWAGTTVDYGCFAPVQAFVEVFKHFGIEPTMQEVREPMGMLKIDHIRTMLHMPRIQKLWEEKYGQASTEEDVEKLYGLFEEKLMSILDRFAQPKPYVLEVVKELRARGIKIGSTTGYSDWKGW